MEDTRKKKTCNICKGEKDETEFRDRRITCNECRTKITKEEREKYAETAHTITIECTICKVKKPGTEFYYKAKRCKPCIAAADSDTTHKPSATDPAKTCSHCKTEKPATEYRYKSLKCKACDTKKLYEWRAENSETFKKICKTYREKEDKKLHRAQYLKEKYTTDMNNRLEKLYRNRVRHYIKIGGGKSSKDKYTDLLGCSYETLIKWLESNFVEGMTWNNYGDVWQIDHTTPCSVFDFTIEENAKACFNWSNLYPLFGEENLEKSCKINMKQIEMVKQKARDFMKANKTVEFRTESLPADLQEYSGVLDTKVPSGTLRIEE